MRLLRLAALQATPKPSDTDAAWAQLERKLAAVSTSWPWVELVVLPELYLCAMPEFGTDGDGVGARAEPVPGPATARLGELARRHRVWIVGGSILERDANGRIRNTTPVLDPSGALVATYRKVFPWQPYETTDPGRRFTVFDIPDVGRIGLAICYDGSFPETARQLAWLGAEVVIQPTLTTTSDRDLEIVFARANAAFNQVYLVNVNSAAPLALGQSVIVDPEGGIRQQAGTTDEVLVDTLDLDAVTRVRSFGTLGLNRPWDQLNRTGAKIQLPAYGGHFVPTPWAEADAPSVDP